MPCTRSPFVGLQGRRMSSAQRPASPAAARRAIIGDMAPLNGWANFYVIVGASADALTGLQFVVMTHIAGRSADRLADVSLV